jgi:hypothetical protein
MKRYRHDTVAPPVVLHVTQETLKDTDDALKLIPADDIRGKEFKKLTFSKVGIY